MVQTPSDRFRERGGRALRRENVNLRLIIKHCVPIGQGILEQAAFSGDTQGESVALNSGRYAGEEFLLVDAQGRVALGSRRTRNGRELRASYLHGEGVYQSGAIVEAQFEIAARLSSRRQRNLDVSRALRCDVGCGGTLLAGQAPLHSKLREICKEIAVLDGNAQRTRGGKSHRLLRQSNR